MGTRPLLQWCLTEALEAGYREIGVVTSAAKPLVETYMLGGGWREGLLDRLQIPAEEATVRIFHQAEPRGVVDAVLAAEEWVSDGEPFAIYLPDNVRIAGPPPLPAALLEEVRRAGRAIVACHRVGPETRHFFGNVGRIELEELVPAGERPRVLELQSRGAGSFDAPPEGAWRMAPRTVVTADWLAAARDVAAESGRQGTEADDVEVLSRLAAAGRLEAAPWTGTLVDAGHPVGYLYAQHLLHEAGSRDRDAADEGDPAATLLEIDLEGPARTPG